MAATVAAFAGADRPPPPGFWWLVALLAAWSVWAGYLVWGFLAPGSSPRPRTRWVRLGAAGGGGAAVVALALVVLALVRRADVTPAVLIGVLVAVLGGAALACLAGGLAALMTRSGWTRG